MEEQTLLSVIEHERNNSQIGNMFQSKYPEDIGPILKEMTPDVLNALKATPKERKT